MEVNSSYTFLHTLSFCARLSIILRAEEQTRRVMSSRVTFRCVYTRRSEKKRKTQLDGYLQCISSSCKQTASSLSSLSTSTSKKLVLMDASQKVIWQQNFRGTVNENEEIDLGNYIVDVEQIDIEDSGTNRSGNPGEAKCSAQVVIKSDGREEQQVKNSEGLFPEAKIASKPFKGYIDPSKTHAVDPFRSFSNRHSSFSTSLRKPLLPLSVQSSSTIPMTSKPASNSNNKANIVPQLDSLLEKKLKIHQVEAVKFILRRLYDDNSLLLPPDHDHKDCNDDDDDDDVVDDDEDFVQRSPSQSQNSSSSSKNTAYLCQGIRGAILGDEMGLGKTLTSIACLYSIIRHDRSKKAIVVVPSSLIDHWEKEIKRWLGPKLVPLCCRSGDKSESTINNFRMSHAAQSPLLIISYEMFRKHAENINEVPYLEVIICDEAHRLKNVESTQTTTALKRCKATKRIIISGTLIQNEIAELYSIVDFAAPGLLGSYASFKHKYANPIKAPSGSSQAKIMSEQLSNLLSLILLRRTQAEINTTSTTSLPPRRETILYCFMTQDQCYDYERTAESIFHSVDRNVPEERFISSAHMNTSKVHDEDNIEKNLDAEAVESKYRASISCGQVLPGLLQLRKICNFASKEEKEELDLSSISADELLSQSSKLGLIDECMKEWQRTCPTDKVVVVSNFVTMLDKVEILAKMRNWSFLRLDGAVPTTRRQALVDRFNQPLDLEKPNPSPIMFLLSSRAGGLGLNLIGANRLVMIDCDWNPATDKQAMARIWREGQTKPVFIYRLVSTGAIESSIYRRQNKKLQLESLLNDNSEESSSHIFSDVIDSRSNIGEASSMPLPPKLSGVELEQLIYPTPSCDEAGIHSVESPELPQDVATQNVLDKIGIGQVRPIQII